MGPGRGGQRDGRRSMAGDRERRVRWKGDNQARAKVERMAEQVTKGILATFGVYESDC